MLVVIITSSSLEESRMQQDKLLDVLGEDGISPILWLEYVAIRTRPTMTVFSNRYMLKIVDRKDLDFVITDDPVSEAYERLKAGR